MRAGTSERRSLAALAGVPYPPEYLVIGDNYFPGWTAAVDGRPAPLLRADYALDAVALPAGAHTVELVYRPASFLIGIVLSGIGLGLAATGWAGVWLRQRRSRVAR